MENIAWEIHDEKSWVVFAISGRLDRLNAEGTGRQADELLAGHEKLALDLSKLEYISSAGLRILLRLAKGAKAHGKGFVLCGAAGFVREVLEDSNMDVLVDMYGSVEQLP